MRKITLLITAVSLVSLPACMEEAGQEQPRQQTRIGVSLDNVRTRTYLDPDESAATRKVFWSEGDEVNINGARSLPLTAGQAGKPEAGFSCYSGAAPFKVIYPASICGDRKYSDNGSIVIDIPSRQEYSPSSFGKGAAVLYGYGEETPVALHNLCGAVRVTLKDASVRIRKAVLISNDASHALAGTFSLDPRTGECSAVSGISSVELDVDEVALDADGQSFYFTLPEGHYPDGFTLRFYGNDDEVMECRWLDDDRTDGNEGVTIVPGRLYQFRPVDFVSGGLLVMSAEDWIYIAEQINSGSDSWKDLYLDDETNTVKFGADLVLPDDAPAINEFSAIIDGCGHTVTRQTKVAPLVKKLKGTVRNLKVSGSVTAGQMPSDDGGVVAVVPFVDELDGGTLENCTSSMDIAIASCARDAAFAGFVNTAKGGSLKKCVNEGDISFTSDCRAASRQVYGGGFVGMAVPDAKVVIEECENKGCVSLMILLADTNPSAGARNVGVGGFIGRIQSGDKENHVRIYKCTNKGGLSINSTEITTLDAAFKYQSSLGGIVGLAAETNATGAVLANPVAAGNCYVEMESCTNEAELHNNMLSRCGSHDIDSKIYTGGLVGSMFGLKDAPALMKDCSNSGNIIPYEGTAYARQAFCGVCGGFVGVGGYLTIDGGEVRGSIGTKKSYSYAQAGIMGMALTRFDITGVDVRADISMAETKTYSEGNYALAVTSSDKLSNTWKSLSGSTVAGCRSGGRLHILEKPGTYNKDKVDTGSLGDNNWKTVSVTETDSGSYMTGSSYSGSEISVSNKIQD